MCPEHVLAQKKKQEVKTLLGSHLRQLHASESKTSDNELRSFYSVEEAILEEVFRAAQGHDDDKSLLKVIDGCIKESTDLRRLSTSRGLKSYFALRVRVLRAALLLIRRFLRKKRWLKKRVVRK